MHACDARGRGYLGPESSLTEECCPSERAEGSILEQQNSQQQNRG